MEIVELMIWSASRMPSTSKWVILEIIWEWIFTTCYICLCFLVSRENLNYGKYMTLLLYNKANYGDLRIYLIADAIAVVWSILVSKCTSFLVWFCRVKDRENELCNLVLSKIFFIIRGNCRESILDMEAMRGWKKESQSLTLISGYTPIRNPAISTF